jgi:hypothetical protein
MRDKNPSLLLKKLFFFVFFYLFSSCVPLSMMQVLIEREKGFMQKRRKREGGERERESHRNVSLSSSPTPTAVPREACQCLYCYLICKNGKIVLASV